MLQPVTGESPAVLAAPDANLLVVVAGDDVVVLDSATEGVTITPLESMDTSRSLGSVALSGVAVTEDQLLRGGHVAHRTERIHLGAHRVDYIVDAMLDYHRVRSVGEFLYYIVALRSMKRRRNLFIRRIGFTQPHVVGNGCFDKFGILKNK